jgi:hypothetical protein
VPYFAVVRSARSKLVIQYLGLAVSSNDESHLVRFCFFPMKGPSSFEKTASVGRGVSGGEAFPGVRD